MKMNRSTYHITHYLEAEHNVTQMQQVS